MAACAEHDAPLGMGQPGEVVARDDPAPVVQLDRQVVQAPVRGAQLEQQRVEMPSAEIAQLCA